jgi:hypothetical protein
MLKIFAVILDGAEHDNGEQAEEMLPTWGEALIRPEKGILNLGLNLNFNQRLNRNLANLSTPVF